MRAGSEKVVTHTISSETAGTDINFLHLPPRSAHFWCSRFPLSILDFVSRLLHYPPLFLDLRMPPSIMFSTQATDKPMSEKQRLKFEKFKQKQENLAQKSQHISERKTKRQGTPMVAAKDWVEETPAGHRKILKPLDDDFHKAYLPKVVESAWYSFWEDHGLFKPQTEKDGRLKPKGKYVIAMPPPNVCACGSISAVVILLTPEVGDGEATHRTRLGALTGRHPHQMASHATVLNSFYPWLRSCRYCDTSCCREAARQESDKWQVQEARFQPRGIRPTMPGLEGRLSTEYQQCGTQTRHLS